MAFKDHFIDKKLNIRTEGRIDKFSSGNNYPYEPTDYVVLDKILEAGLVGPNDHLIDYGCGLGRVSFYMASKVGCHCTGVERVEELYMSACENLKSARAKNLMLRVNFVHSDAKDFIVPDDATCFYFFNPFSWDIMEWVMLKIFDKVKSGARLMFYYPDDRMVEDLAGVSKLRCVGEIDCMDLFPKRDKRNVVRVYEVI